MADEDVLEQARAAGLTIATGVSRLGDTFIRAAQQRAEADVRDKQLQAEDAQRRYEAKPRSPSSCIGEQPTRTGCAVSTGQKLSACGKPPNCGPTSTKNASRRLPIR